MSNFPAPFPYTPTPNYPNSTCFLDPNSTLLTLALASKYFFLKTGDYASFVNSSLYQLDGNNILMSALINVTAGTASASKCLVLDASSNITGLNNITFSGSLVGSIINANTFLLSGSSILMSALTGSIVAGTALANKALVLDASSNISGIATLGLSSTSGGDMLTLTTTSTTARNTIKFITDNQSWEIGSRGSTASNPTNFYIYNAAYKLLMNPTGDTSILSSTDSTSASTGCLKLSGGLGIVKNIYCTGWLDLTRNGSNLSINNPSSGNSALIELAASPNILRLSRGFVINIGTSGINIESGSTRDPRSVIDLGQTASNKHIALYNDTGSYYGISANNSALQIQSGGGLTFYSGCTNASPLGTKVFGVGSAGRIEIPNNQYIGNASYNNMIYLASTGTVLINSSSVSNSSNWLEVNGQTYFNGNIGLGINAPYFPLHINSSNVTDISFYGYVSTGGSTGYISGSSGSITVGLKVSNRVICGEINLVCDRRIKRNITDITNEEALAFLTIRPVHYILKKCDTPSFGYIAQDIMKNEAFKNNKYILADIINICPEPGIAEEIDEDGFLNPADNIFTVNYPKCVPLLHKIIQLQDKRINENEEEITYLKSSIVENENSIRYLMNKLIETERIINNLTNMFRYENRRNRFWDASTESESDTDSSD